MAQDLSVGSIGDDVLCGADEIGRFLFGDTASKSQAYRAIQHGLPIFKIGNRVYARKSTLLSWIAGQEQKS